MLTEKIVRLAVTEPHGAMVGVPVPYKAHALLRNDEFDDNDASIHYVWNFNDFVRPCFTQLVRGVVFILNKHVHAKNCKESVRH